MHKHPPAIAAALAVVAALALSACSPGSPHDTSHSASAHTAPAEARTPFSSYWDAMYGVHNDSDEIAKRERVEGLIADCMAAEGFDYTPVDQHPPTAVTPYMDGYGTEDWAARHGYGLFPTAEETRQMDAQIASEDPNQKYVDSLSESEQGAYYAALQNPAGSRDTDVALKQGGEIPAYDWTKAGCQGSAEHEVNGDDPTQSGRYDDLIAAMNALGQGQLADPAMVPIDSEWSECMAADGYDGFPTRQSASDAVFDQSSDYWDSGATDDPDDETVAGWRAFEIEVAVADFRCAESVDYDAKALVVQVARENQFIKDNTTELDEMLAEIAQGN